MDNSFKDVSPREVALCDRVFRCLSECLRLIKINLYKDEYFDETELNNAKDLENKCHKCYINRSFENENANIIDTCIENMDTKENTSKNLNNIICNDNMDTIENTSKNLNNDICNENMDEIANTSENLDVKDDEYKRKFRLIMNDFLSHQAYNDEKSQSEFKHEKNLVNEDNKIYDSRYINHIRVIRGCTPNKFGIIVSWNAKKFHYLQNKYNVDIVIPDPEKCKELPQIILIKYNENEEEFDNAIKEIKNILDN